MTTVDGTLSGHAFQATLEPDGQGSHWFKVPRALREAVGADAGDTVTLEIAPVEKEPEPKVPADLTRGKRIDTAIHKLASGMRRNELASAEHGSALHSAGDECSARVSAEQARASP